ncbi:hypothetical protein BMF94_4074 [Rhodotorula taiwanensis]|uniref:Uncharacterized protein n=1 Tax=Rhodotorula taiwanensis TaxID=741276 RepID=A0A2S5B806_9BASI|nr:hypothetical protein BMF94_4074 [Rhodotorula taiwanensis]
MRFSVAVTAWASLATLLIASPSARLDKRAKTLLERGSNPDDPSGTPLYVTEPACGYYRCIVTWPIGSKVAVNWINPIQGNVNVLLESNIGGPTYTIASNIPAISQEGYCDSGAGTGVVQPGNECGQVQFVVPDGWQQMNNYTIVVQSSDNPNLAGYTDMITIAAANSSSPSAVPASEVPTGTNASLLTIPAPTSTNVGASVAYTGNLPAPTAISASPSSSSGASSSSGRTTASAKGQSNSASAAGSASASSATSGTSSAGSAAAASASSSPTSGAASTREGAYLALVAVVAAVALF